MKKLSILAVLICICSVALAHTVTPLCYADGRFKFSGTSFPANGKVRVTIVNSSGNPTGAFDTLFNSSASAFTFSVPKAASSNVRVRVRHQNSSGNVQWEAFEWTTTKSCNIVTPLKYSLFKVEKVGGNKVRVHLKIHDVANVSHINIQVSSDGGKEYKNITVILPDNIKTEQEFIVDVKI